MQSQVQTSNQSNVGEASFIKHADSCLETMQETASKDGLKGVAVVIFIPNNTVKEWISKMKVVGVFTKEKRNLLAIAYSKASEMAETLKDSGGNKREPFFGEFGYKGGVIKKVKHGYIATAFSGGSGQQDFEISNIGLNYITPFFN
jgi:hypothetical protein